MDLIEAKHKTNTNRHPWEYARFEVLKHFLKSKLVNKENPTIVDIGCGDSFVVESISKIYPNAKLIAVDTAFTSEIIEHYKERLNNPNIAFYYNVDEVLGNVKADCILLMDVIEHIEFDISFMKLVLSKSFTTADTKWFITVPAFQSLYCSHDTFLGHYRRYDNKMLVDHTAQAGLKTVTVGYFFTSLLLPRYLQVKKESSNKTDHSTTGLVEWNGSSFKTSLIKTVLVVDFKITAFLKAIGIKLPGLSNYIICQKSA
jgi:hypothetical protein